MKEIKGYEGLYWIDKDGYIYNRHGKKLKGFGNYDGYCRIILSNNGVRRKYLVHRLVAQQFIPNPNNLPMVNHKDGDKNNNCKDNLEWCTGSYNARHAVKIGLIIPPIPKKKLTEKQVLEIRKKYVPKIYGFKRLGIEYSVSKTTIMDIIKRKTWTHI